MVTKRQLSPPAFTPTMGAYSHGLEVDLGVAKLVFVTGQIAMNKDGEVVSDDIEEQTRFVFENIKQILLEADATFEDVVKAQIFLLDIKDFGRVSPIRNEYFGDSKPVSTLVEVTSLVKEGCKIEVEVLAVKS